jgi:hypothetical protein
MGRLTNDENDMTNINSRKIVRKPDGTAVLSLSALTVAMLTAGAEKFVENVDNMDTAPFEVKTRERDTFLANALHDAQYNVKDAAALVATRMQGCDKTVIAKTVDTLCYGVLKTAMFGAWLAYNSALARREGAVPDSFFALYNRKPAPEVGEVDIEDVKQFPADQREEYNADAPPGLAQAHEALMTIHGVKLDGTIDELAPQVASALEDARLHLENIRNGYGYTGHDRIPFFVEQINGEWVRHTGSAYDALLAFEQKMDANRQRKAAQAESVFRRHNEAALASA